MIPALDEGAFGQMTIGSQLRVIERSAGAGPVMLIGSSLGGYLAALYASRHPEVERLVLMAPAFGFLGRWTRSLGAEAMAAWRRDGSREIFHFGSGRTESLGWEFVEEAQAYEEEPRVQQPVLVWHGVHDDVVPVEASRAFARNNPQARLVEADSGHELTDVAAQISDDAVDFLLRPAD